MNQVNNNVTRLQQNSVFNDIQSFLRNKGGKSRNTEVAYESDLRQFFKYMRNKDIEDLNDQDLNFKNSDMIDYQTYMRREYVQTNGKRLSNTTINRKINSVYSLYTFLKKNEYNVDPEKIKVDELADDSKPIGFLTVEEVESMLDLLGDSRKDEEIRAFITIALHTSLRKEAIINLTWDQISKSHEGSYIITTMDKGKQNFKDIEDEVYEMLLSLKTDSNRIFTIPVRTLEYNFKSLCRKIGVDEMRNVSIHSLKKTGIDFVNEVTNSLQAAQEQGGHSSPSVTAKIYTRRPKNLAGKLLKMRTEKDIFQKLTHEECIQLLESFGNGLGYQLREGAKKIIDTRK